MQAFFDQLLQAQYHDVMSSLALVLGTGVIALLLALVGRVLTRRLTTVWGTSLHANMLSVGTLVFWFVLLAFSVAWSDAESLMRSWAVAGQSLLAIFIVYKLAYQWIPAKNLARLIVYSVVPLILLNSLGLLSTAIATLDGYALDLGNIHITLFDVLRVAYFGVILFWLGRESNRVGKKKIRQQKNLDSSTKEIIAKLFEVGIFIVVALLLLNILGINLTTLAVVGGAVGVGIGIGLQSIASNFISGLIILLDRSLSIGDYIELDDGRSGTITELTLRAATLETFDGKDIVVPNDVFFTETFTNWTHKNKKQRYAINFNVAYSTDLDRLFPLVKEMLAEHPMVMAGDHLPIEERPDIEICGFGDNGIDLLIEFWMEAIDDGPNRVGGDLLYSLWKLMKENGFEFPFPQREVRLLK
ncbi:mechanosensitive ion channel family protein [Salinibius halmophilus]|uniref:mechanosensitive ion channel family protein n=1 Tax=Salinibius halmophilus TaxID=1853216 RepID=UPI000E6682CD|nr:mechanosensitive ion channel domain-containing protein [Salinibius halmophilus]